ncbi:MAG: response regulator, partial [Bacteroidota bacterium]
MQKRTVLLVMENPAESAALRRHLEGTGFQIVAMETTLSGALGVFFATQPDLVVVDVILHGLPEGLSFAQAIRRNGTTPLIFLSSQDTADLFLQARQQFPVSYLLKPCTPAAIQYALELAYENTEMV